MRFRVPPCLGYFFSLLEVLHFANGIFIHREVLQSLYFLKLLISRSSNLMKMGVGTCTSAFALFLKGFCRSEFCVIVDIGLAVCTPRG